MPRTASFAVIAAAFLAGLFLPDWVGRAAVPPRPPASAVALDAAPEETASRAEPGLAPGGALRRNADGTVEPEGRDVITPLNVRDAAALVMSPGPLKPCRETPCDCSRDSLHRYAPRKLIR